MPLPLSADWIRTRAKPPDIIASEERWNQWCPHNPTPKQLEFLALEVLEAFYGGQAGGGKSDALLMAFLQFAHVPGYAGLILRRTYEDLSLPGAIMDRAIEWFSNMPGVRIQDGGKRITFSCPGGGHSTLQFGYLENEKDKFRYQSAEFQFIGLDEMPQLTWTQIRYMFSRLRKPTTGPLSKVPLRFRGAGNPGGVSHDEVKEHYIDDSTREPGVVFIRATLDDNPHLDDSYRDSLDKLDPVTRAQLKDGSWDAVAEGDFFDQKWFTLVDALPNSVRRTMRFWDMAATEEPKRGEKKDPDYTASVLLGYDGDVFYVSDVTNDRIGEAKLEKHVVAVAEEDGRGVQIRMEQEPGSSGVITIGAFSRALRGYNFEGIRSTGSKPERAKPLSAAAENGKVCVVRQCRKCRGTMEGTCSHIKAFLNQLHRFPFGKKDMVDAAAGAYNEIAPRPVIKLRPARQKPADSRRLFDRTGKPV